MCFDTRSVYHDVFLDITEYALYSSNHNHCYHLKVPVPSTLRNPDSVAPGWYLDNSTLKVSPSYVTLQPE